jgi:hypothetical protein
VADGDAEVSEEDGDGLIVVGIGTGSVKVGAGEEVASIDGAGEVGIRLAATRRGSGRWGAGCGDHSTGVSGRGVEAFLGAVPRKPTPSGSAMGRRGVAGLPPI